MKGSESGLRYCCLHVGVVSSKGTRQWWLIPRSLKEGRRCRDVVRRVGMQRCFTHPTKTPKSRLGHSWPTILGGRSCGCLYKCLLAEAVAANTSLAVAACSSARSLPFKAKAPLTTCKTSRADHLNIFKTENLNKNACLDYVPMVCEPCSTSEQSHGRTWRSSRTPLTMRRIRVAITLDTQLKVVEGWEK